MPAHYYGVIHNPDGNDAVCRCEKTNPLIMVAASDQGAVSVTLSVDADGIDRAEIRLIPWYNAGESRQLYNGPLGGIMGGPETPKLRRPKPNRPAPT